MVMNWLWAALKSGKKEGEGVGRMGKRGLV